MSNSDEKVHLLTITTIMAEVDIDEGYAEQEG